MQSDAHVLVDLVDLGRVQRICDGLSAATGMALAVLDPEGAILVSSGWQDVSTDPRLRDEAFPLIVGGEHLASVFTGQFFYDDDEIDLPAHVPVVSRERVARTIDLLGDFVSLLAENGLSALQREQEHEARRDSEERYKQLFEAESDAVFLIDNATGCVIEANTAAAAMYGFTQDELLTLTNEDLSAEPEKTQAVTQGTPIVVDNVVTIPLRIHRRKDGSTFPVEITGRFFLREGRPVHVAAIRDVTERTQAEAEIRRLNNELEERVLARTTALEAANRELESFAYAVSHDLRAPLRALDGFSAMLLEDYGDRLDDKGRGYLDRIRAADQRMASLIDALLDLSRLNRGELMRERLDLSTMAREIALELVEAEPGRTVELVVADGLEAHADRRLLRALLANLLDNAWKFTARHETARIAVGAVDTGGERAFFVRDDGAGFDIAYADKLFVAFQRLHGADEFEGLGIGLATVQRIVHRHGGRVWAEGEVEQGATFWFTLPRTTPVETSSPC